MTDRVTTEIQDGVADVRLNRPGKMNALDVAMLEEIATAGERLHATAGLRAVVLSGEGGSFCAGLDIASFAGGLPVDLAVNLAVDLGARSHGRSNLFQHAAMLWRDLSAPVIAAVRGACFGGGLQIALGADIRIAAPDARFSLMEIKWGLVPDMGGFVLTRGLVRGDVLRELVYSGRVVDAPESVTIGLATRIAEDPMAEALGVAHMIAGRNPDAVRAAKRLLEAMNDSVAADLLSAESAAQVGILAKPNQREAVMAHMQKRAPRFKD